MNLTYLLLKTAELCKLDSSSLGDKAANTTCHVFQACIKHQIILWFCG